MLLIDTHIHIYLPEFNEDRVQLIENSVVAGISTFFMPAIDSTTHEIMLQVEDEFQPCIAMMGLHPCSVKNDYLQELETVKTWLQKRKFIAVGETGLDLYWDKTFLVQQYEAFHAQIEWALNYDLPVVIHSRDATAECIKVVQQYKNLRGVFHCFSGTIDQAKEIIDLGFYLGIGGVVTFKNGGLDKVIEQLGIANVVMETDAPYLAPVPFRGKRNHPEYLMHIARKISTVSGKDLREVVDITSANARKLFNLK